MPRTIYMKHQDKTYIYDDKDNLISILPGDKSQDPATIVSEVHSANSLKGPKGGSSARTQLGKDILVDLASQAPFMAIPGMSRMAQVARPAASFLSGLVADQALQPDKDLGDSAISAGANTAVSSLANHFGQNPPNIGNFDKAKGWGVRGIIGGIIKAMQGDPLIPEVAATTPVVRGAGGKWVSNAKDWAAYQDYVKKFRLLNATTNAAGLGINAAIDWRNTDDSK